MVSALFRGCVVCTVTHFSKDLLKCTPFSICSAHTQFVSSKSKMVGGEEIRKNMRIKVLHQHILSSPVMPNGSTLLLEKDFSYFVVIVIHFQVDVGAALNICHWVLINAMRKLQNILYKIVVIFFDGFSRKSGKLQKIVKKNKAKVVYTYWQPLS